MSSRSPAPAAADVLPAARRGTGYAVLGFLLTLGGALGPLLIGGISELSGSLQLAMLLAVLPALPGGLVVLRGRSTFASDAQAARRNPPEEPPPTQAGSLPTTPT